MFSKDLKNRLVIALTSDVVADELENAVEEAAQSGGGAGETNTASNLGAGEGVFAAKVAEDLQFKSLVAGSNVNLTSDGNTITISAIDTDTGESNTISNLGAGSQIFKQKTGVDFELRTLVAGSNISITQNLDTITIDSIDTGEANTASNLGAGEGVFASKVSEDLQFKSLIGGTNVSLVADGNSITINSVDTGEANTASNLGAGEGIFSTKVGDDLQFKSLVAGSNISFSSDGNTITVNATDTDTGEVNTASNLGLTGEGVFASKVGEDLQFKKLIGGTNVTLTAGADSITIDSPDTGEVNTASSVGAANEVFKQKVGEDLQFRTLVAGANVSITQNADTLEIAATAGGGGGDVTGPASSVDNSIARYDGTTGKILNNYIANAPTIDDNGVPDFRDLSHASSQRIGLNSSVTGFSATAIGVSATAGAGCTVLGTFASAANGGVAIAGTSSGLQSIAIGASSSSTGDNSVVIGYQGNDNAGGGSTVVGNFARSSAAFGTALGHSSQADGERSTAVGYDAHATGLRSTLVGGLTSDGGQNDCTIVGHGISTDGASNTLLGYNITKNGTVAATGNTAVGNGVVYGRFDNIAIGNQASIGADLGRSIVIGRAATLSHTGTGSMSATVVGYSADSVNSPSSTVIGANAQANTASVSVSLGNNAISGATEAIAIGVSAVADGIGSLALGRLADTNAQDYSMVIGRQATTEAPNTCVIGNAGSLAITDFYLGGSYRNTHSLPIDVAIQPSRQRATGGGNVAGNKLILKTGTSSGTGAGGDFELYTAETGTVASNAENTTQNIMYKATSAQENIFTAKNAVTADGSLHNESISFYLDEATNELKVKVKYSNGTVKIGTVSNLPV